MFIRGECGRIFVLFLLIGLVVSEIVLVDGTPGDPLQKEPSKLEHEFENPRGGESPDHNDQDMPLVSLDSGGFIKEEPTDPEAQKKRYERLYGWLAAEGTTASPSLSIQYIEEMNHRGLVTGVELLENSVLLSIRRHMMLSTLPPLEDDPEDIPFCDLTRRWPHLLLKKLFTSEDEMEEPIFSSSRSPNILLALCLIHETKKSGGSFYQPYLNILPQKLSQPLVWKKKNLYHLQASPIYPAVLSAKEKLEQDYTQLAEILFTHPNQGFTLEHYNWAMLIVSTRASDITVPGRKQPVKALVPVIDMINMAEGFDLPSTRITTTRKGKDLFQFRVEKSIPANAQILNSEAVCDNSLCFLLNHGYLPPNIHQDYIPLNLIHSEDNSLLYIPILEDYAAEGALTESLLLIKSQILIQNHLSTIKVGLHFDDTLIAMFRFLCATQKEIDEIIHNRSLISIYSVISDSNESCAVHSLYDLMESTLKSYSTSLKHDEFILNKIPPEDNEMKLAIQMRMREKRIITDIMNLLENYPNVTL